MVDFQKVCDFFPKDVYREAPIYKTSKKFVRQIKTAPVRGEKENKISSTANEIEEDYFFISQRLAERRKRALRVLDHITTQKKKLHEKEDEFQQRFIEFNEHIILNDQKKERAELRLKVYRSHVKEQNAKIEKMLHIVLGYRKCKEKLIKEIEKHRIYEEFIESALYDFGQRATINDVLTRYSSLESKKRYLMSRNVAVNKKIRETYEQTLATVEDKCHKIMKMKAQISRIAVSYDDARKKTSQLESLMASLKDFCAIRLEDLVLSVQGIKNLNEFMRIRREARKIPMKDHEGLDDMARVFHQIVAIKDTMRYTANIVETFEMRSKVLRNLWRKAGHAVLGL